MISFFKLPGFVCSCQIPCTLLLSEGRVVVAWLANTAVQVLDTMDETQALLVTAVYTGIMTALLCLLPFQFN